jgi:cbb3-type cytochrome oxidase subunit 1
MDRYVKNFIGASLLFLGIASILGVFMLVKPSLAGSLRFPHSHLMLIGWVTMMIYGVGYHILPRFAGKIITSIKIAEIQFWLAMLGLIGMVVFQPMVASGSGSSAIITLVGLSGVLQILSSVLFVYNMGSTLFRKDEETPA